MSKRKSKAITKTSKTKAVTRASAAKAAVTKLMQITNFIHADLSEHSGPFGPTKLRCRHPSCFGLPRAAPFEAALREIMVAAIHVHAIEGDDEQANVAVVADAPGLHDAVVMGTGPCTRGHPTKSTIGRPPPRWPTLLVLQRRPQTFARLGPKQARDSRTQAHREASTRVFSGPPLRMGNKKSPGARRTMSADGRGSMCRPLRLRAEHVGATTER